MATDDHLTPIGSMTQSALFHRIGDICAGVNAVMDEKELLSDSLKNIMALFGVSRGSIFILDDTNENLALETSVGLKHAEKDRLVKKLGEGVVGKVAQTKHPIIVKDIAKDRRFKQEESSSGSYRTPSFICAPLLVKDQLIGVINITDKISGGMFEDDEMQLLDFLASQIALNYRRLQLYKKFKGVIKETQSLREQLGASGKEQEFLKRQVYIQEKLATIGKLAGGIAHEFNNPLDGVMRYTNLCLEYVKEDDVVRGYLLEIQQGLNRMARIVKNLLACSHSELRSNSKLDFYKSLEYCLSGVKQKIESKDIKIIQDIDKDIPPIRDLGLERVLSNLIHNAVDAIDQKGKITIQAKYNKDEFVLSVKDTGKGVIEEDVEKLFEPFFTTKDMDKGCGLGLTIVGEVVKGYEGHIDVKSKVDKGTQFIITIPAESLS